MTRPTRSWMFVPANRQRFVDKAAQCNADAVFLDLEDGVLPSGKEEARTMATDAMQQAAFRPARYVRVNARSTPWFDADLEAVVRPGLDGICLPKAESPEDVDGLAARLAALEDRAGLPAGQIRIVAAIESAAALLRAPAIAAAHPRLTGLMFGAEDFALDLGLGAHRKGAAAELLYARSAIVTAAAAARVLSIDGVFPNLDDDVGLQDDLTYARQLGFTSKSTFNPRQLTAINQALSPTREDVDYARLIVTAFQEADSRGDASIAVGGQLIDLPIVRRAQRTLDVSQLLGIGDGSVG